MRSGTLLSFSIVFRLRPFLGVCGLFRSEAGRRNGEGTGGAVDLLEDVRTVGADAVHTQVQQVTETLLRVIELGSLHRHSAEPQQHLLAGRLGGTDVVHRGSLLAQVDTVEGVLGAVKGVPPRREVRGDGSRVTVEGADSDGGVSLEHLLQHIPVERRYHEPPPRSHVLQHVENLRHALRVARLDLDIHVQPTVDAALHNLLEAGGEVLLAPRKRDLHKVVVGHVLHHDAFRQLFALGAVRHDKDTVLGLAHIELHTGDPEPGRHVDRRQRVLDSQAPRDAVALHLNRHCRGVWVLGLSTLNKN
eukprot:Hpha_TRINITY_DN15626_c3_g10::TRINITY_DN15626_c3_g10_i1::g.100238::m.100238